MIKPLTVALKPENAFADLFPEGAPVTTLSPMPMDLTGQGVEECYLLAGDRCTTAQMEAVAGRVAELFNARVSDVRDELIARGLPIRASQVQGGPAMDLRFIL